MFSLLAVVALVAASSEASSPATDEQARTRVEVQRDDAGRAEMAAASAPVTPRSKTLFARLFAPSAQQPNDTPSREPPLRQWKPKVVCGMLLIPGDPSVDPGIRVERRDSDTKFTIRAIEPPICWPQ
jgi:hypothetical protein